MRAKTGGGGGGAAKGEWKRRKGGEGEVGEGLDAERGEEDGGSGWKGIEVDIGSGGT